MTLTQAQVREALKRARKKLRGQLGFSLAIRKWEP